MKQHALASAVFTFCLITACSTPNDTPTRRRETVQAPPNRPALQQEIDEQSARTVMATPVTPRTEAIAIHDTAAAKMVMAREGIAPAYEPPYFKQPQNEKYQRRDDNAIQSTAQHPVSTFALDVDSGAYSNVRRFIRQGQLPLRDAIRVEELINYFSYQDADPEPGHPFAVQTELASAPWEATHQLLRLRIKATDMKTTDLPPVNVVFLVDVSGSMDEADKLPLVKSSLHMLVDQLRADDDIALVVYAGRTHIELPPTKARNKALIHAAIDRLTAAGSTAGGAAIELAYNQAQQAFKPNGINRIILCTDGDFNVGISDTEQLKDRVVKNRELGITLTTLGFGQGNYNDAMMEQIADVGNGHYAYIDSADEARKVLVDELSATFNVVAKDAKIQIEFNPAVVAEYRLIGYENRLLREQDFNNDKVDAGDVGAGKSVTALYEITPVGAPRSSDPHRYQTPTMTHQTPHHSELAYLKVRYKTSDNETSTLLSKAIYAHESKGPIQNASDDFRFAAAVAAFGQLLRDSVYTKHYQLNDVTTLARSATGNDTYGYRHEFIRLSEIAATLKPHKSKQEIGLGQLEEIPKIIRR